MIEIESRRAMNKANKAKARQGKKDARDIRGLRGRSLCCCSKALISAGHIRSPGLSFFSTFEAECYQISRIDREQASSKA